MKTLILHNIISSNTVYKLNSFIEENKKKFGETFVAFCAETESNRKWKLSEKIKFKYSVLRSSSLELKGSDLFTYFFSPGIIKLLNTYNPDRIIICGWDQFAYQAAFIWGFIKQKHITLWSGSTNGEKSWRRLVSLPLVKMFIRMSKDYIVYGQKAENYLISLGAKRKSITIYMNDVNKKFFRSESKKWRKQREKIKKSRGISTKYNFIYVGQIIERKGVMDLITAFASFKLQNPDWGLIIVGYGQQEGLVKNFLKQRKVRDVRFLGKVEQYKLPKIYAMADCLILPSKEEVWGLVVNEALYCDLKVLVSSRCGCSPDLVKLGQNGYTFEPHKHRDLLEKMEKISKIIQPHKFEPLFSIITCTRNSSKYLVRNIKSIQSQSFKNYEQIFIDGFSKDKTVEIIKKYQETSPKNVKIYKSKPKGISNAMNIGITKAIGQYILVLHADDRFYDKDVLKKVYYQLLDNPNIDLLYGKINVIEEDGNSIGQYPARKIYSFFPKYFSKYYNLIPHQGVFISKSVFRKFGGFDESLSSVMDVDYWLRIRNYTKWKFMNTVISNYMVRRGAQSSGIEKKFENDRNTFDVKSRYLNKFEMKIFKVVKKVADYYNSTYR